MSSIPFNRISFDGDELLNIQQAVDNLHVSGNGPFSKKAEDVLSQMHGGAKVFLTPSCSDALELSARLLDLRPGDEVIVPSFTFVTSVSSFVMSGARPVFCDIDPVTLGLDLAHAESLVTEKTRAVVLVHYGGVPANPEQFRQLAKKHGLVLIEDNAHGLGGTYQGKALGTYGSISTLSFHETKNVTCGEGGAIVLNDDKLLPRAEILREKGTDRSQFFNGKVDKYTWRDLGSSWVLSDILAAVLLAQLSRFESIQAGRLERWHEYHVELLEWAETEGVLLPACPGTGHVFYLVFQNHALRERFVNYMRDRGILAVSHYTPLHESPYWREKNGIGASLPVTERISGNLVRLPLSSSLSRLDQNAITRAVKQFRTA